MTRDSRAGPAESPMAVAVDLFRDLLPPSLIESVDYKRLLRTLSALPQMFAGNGFGIECELAPDGSAGRSSLSVSTAMQFDRLGRLNLGRFVDRYLTDWIVAGRFRDTLIEACRGLAGFRDAALFPERCYFGFEVPDDDDTTLRVAGAVWAYLLSDDRLDDVPFEQFYRQLLGARYDGDPRSLQTLYAICGEHRLKEIGYGVRGDREVFKAYFYRHIERNIAVLDHFHAAPTDPLRALLGELARDAPDWRSFCAIDVIDGQFARVGFEFNLEREGSRVHLPVLLDSRLIRDCFPRDFLPVLQRALDAGEVTRMNFREQRCRFGVTHLKVSLDHRQTLRWKVYYSFRALDDLPPSLPFLVPWLSAFQTET